jgi:FAD/FMN-containing dehydrogenase
MTTPPPAPTDTLVVEFEGWYQYRLPTDPDPTDETRGSSGYTFAFGDEPDLDRILRFQPDPKIPVRSYGPPIGVRVTRATKLTPAGDEDLPGLVGATVDLLDRPMLLNRNWVLTLPGYEPIVPFNLEVKTADLRIYREAPVVPPDAPPGAPQQPIQDVPEGTLTLYGASGLAYEPDTVAPAIDVWDPVQQYRERLAELTAARKALTAVDEDDPRLAILDGRIAQLEIGLTPTPTGPDRRVGVRHVIERFGFTMRGKIDVSGDQPGVLGGELDTTVGASWRIDFWMGGFDPDALCAFVRGALRIPYAAANPGGSSSGRSGMAVNRRVRSQLHQQRIDDTWPPDGHQAYEDLGVSKAELAKLQSELRGTAVTPGTPGYDKDRMGSGNSQYESWPKLIVYCKVINDVAVCLAWAKRHKWWITCRSGGHSTAGFSVNSGMVIDVSELDYIVVDPANKIAHVGPGAQFYDLNTTLASFGLHVPGGGCGSVSAGGFVQGGGFGFTSRKYGMNCDNVEAVLMMLADGSLVRADADTNPDLFWAVRGGTGDQFGVLLDITYRLHDLDEVWGFALKWSLDEAPAAMARMQQDYTLSLDTIDVSYMGGITRLQGKTVFTMFGVYPGKKKDGKKALEPLLETGKPELAVSQVGTYAELDEHLIDNFLPGVPPGITFEAKDCAYVTELLGADDWAEILAYHDQHTPNDYNIMFVEPYGGVTNTMPAGFNAFIHRDTYMDLYVDSFWQREWSFTGEEAANEFLKGYMALIGKHSDGQKYQNYPRRDAPDFRWAYWRDAYNSLLFVKQKYDPDGVFNFLEAITPYPNDPGIHRSDAPSTFSSPTIEYEPWSRAGRREPDDD